jgi:hypothetical protein
MDNGHLHQPHHRKGNSTTPKPKPRAVRNLKFLSANKYEVELVHGRKYRGKFTGGYLWIGDKDGNMHTTIDEDQMDEIAKAWCKHRGIKP